MANNCRLFALSLSLYIYIHFIEIRLLARSNKSNAHKTAVYHWAIICLTSGYNSKPLCGTGTCRVVCGLLLRAHLQVYTYYHDYSCERVIHVMLQLYLCAMDLVISHTICLSHSSVVVLVNIVFRFV